MKRYIYFNGESRSKNKYNVAGLWDYVLRAFAPMTFQSSRERAEFRRWKKETYPIFAQKIRGYKFFTLRICGIKVKFTPLYRWAKYSIDECYDAKWVWKITF